MKTKRFRSRGCVAIQPSRWAAYATAGAASALLPINSAEADITYSGLIDRPFADSSPGAAGGFDLVYFGLGPNASFGLFHYFATNHQAGLYMAGAVSGMFRGSAGPGDFRYPSRLGSGINVSLGNFLPNAKNGTYGATLAFQDYAGNFLAPGTGFIGFRFDGGSGTQYGWIRVNMNGSDQSNTFTLVDYAFADPGEQIFTGQVPEPGSLGLLALGGAGLVIWQKRRRAKRCVG